MAKPFAKQLLWGALFGAAAGLCFFGLETFWLWTHDAVGLNLDQAGPFAALFAVIRTLLPPVIVRVFLAYLLCGAGLGLVAAAVARAWSPAEGRRHRALWSVALLGLFAARVLGHAVERPALFDDLPRFRPLLEWAVRAGEPWHAQLALGAIAASALAAVARRARWRPLPVATLGASAAMLAAIVLFSAARPHPTAVKAPRVVLLGIDAFRPDRLAALGGQRRVAPNLDAFAREATVFSQAYTPIAQTEPAWRSLITARWPPATGVRYPLTPAAQVAALPTFPAALEKLGVRTTFATDCSRFHHEDESSGFSDRWQPPRGALNFALEKLRYRGVGLFLDNAFGAWLLPEFVDNRALAGIHGPHGYAQRLAGRMVDAMRDGEALFAWHSTAAHFPGDPSYPHYRQFVDSARPLERRLRMQFAPIGTGAARASPGAWSQSDAEALYDELLAQSDAQVGVLFEALKVAGLWDDTTVILFSDHGESFHADHPDLWGATPVHGARLGAEENRILLMVKPAGGRRVATVDALVRLVDVGPTVLEAFGAAPLPRADGLSLHGLISGEPEAPRLLYAETGYTHASPAAFDPGHLVGAPRTFDAYVVHPSGVVEMSAEAHPRVIAEKDTGAFDGRQWLVRSPRADGTVEERCPGDCGPLRAFLESVLKGNP
jgi:arylsulfatase A-like enzyme